MTLDGVIQNDGELTATAFKHGGWFFPFATR
jgi:hypothetical protein